MHQTEPRCLHRINTELWNEPTEEQAEEGAAFTPLLLVCSLGCDMGGGSSFLNQTQLLQMPEHKDYIDSVQHMVW